MLEHTLRAGEDENLMEPKFVEDWKELGDKVRGKDVIITIDDNLKGLFLERILKEICPDPIFVDGPRYKGLHDPRHQNYSMSGDIVIGFGGGTNIDQAKVIAVNSGIDWICVPTKTTCAILSEIASIPLEEGREDFPTPTPKEVYLDLQVLAEAPSEFNISECGDSLSSISAVKDAIIGMMYNGEKIDEALLSRAYNAAEIVMGIKDLSSKQDIKALVEAELEYGKVMNHYNPNTRPSSGFEHMISHALDSLGSGKLHGEQVALGVLIASYLQDQLPEVGEKIKDMGLNYMSASDFKGHLQRMSLPTNASEIGLGSDIMRTAVKKARTIRKEKRYTVGERFSDDYIIDILEDKGIFN